MSCLVKSKYIGTITWLGRVTAPQDNIRSEALNTAEATFNGILGESHSGAHPPLLRAGYNTTSQKYRNSKHPSAINLVSRRKCRNCNEYWAGGSLIQVG